MGQWYGAEVINHMDDSHIETYYETCVVIHLEDITEEFYQNEQQHQYLGHDRDRDRNHGYNTGGYDHHRHNNHHRDQNRYLTVRWDERDATMKYFLSFNDNSTGYWRSIAPQQGSLVRNNYEQFTGSIQVMKAVGNHLVLTFCSSAPNAKMFTVILARYRNTLTYDEIKSIKNLLNYRQLPVTSVRRVCINGASSLYITKTGFLLTLISVACVLRMVMSGVKAQQ